MYQCKFCGKEYNTNGNCVRHETHDCLLNPDSSKNKKIKYVCSFCGKRCGSLQGLRRHENYCVNNPQHKEKNWEPWNKGLTKDTNDTIKQQAKNFSARIAKEGYVGCCGLRGDQNPSKRADVKAKVSAKMMGNHYNNPNKTGRGKKGWYKGFYCSSTYELAFVIYCIDNHINIQRYTGFYEYQYDNKTHRYYPDFIIDGCIYEIKGFWTPQVSAKTASVTDKPIKVLYRDDMTDIFTYIKNTYGKQVDIDIHELYE